MQECKALGSGRVIMIGRGKKLEKARELGADVCIDFEKEDPVQRVLELTGGVGADEVMGVLRRCRLSHEGLQARAQDRQRRTDCDLP